MKSAIALQKCINIGWALGNCPGNRGIARTQILQRRLSHAFCCSARGARFKNGAQIKYIFDIIKRPVSYITTLGLAPPDQHLCLKPP